jgi:DNA-binding transcriptional MerR regulator
MALTGPNEPEGGAPLMMTIGIFSERTGLRPKTLRYYEEVGLLVPNVRAAYGYRQYEDNQVEPALLIHSLRQAGVGIADIRRFMAGDGSEQARLLQRWREETEARMLSLQIAKQFLQGFHPLSSGDCLTSYLR